MNHPLIPRTCLYAFTPVRYNPRNFYGKFHGRKGWRMARLGWNRLSARSVAAANKPGMYADGAGLDLRVTRGGGKSWCLRYMLGGEAREMGLGGLSKIGLADVRRKAAEQRLLLADKIDPIDKRKAERAATKMEAARSMTFDECAGAYADA